MHLHVHSIWISYALDRWPGPIVSISSSASFILPIHVYQMVQPVIQLFLPSSTKLPSIDWNFVYDFPLLFVFVF